MKGFWSCVAEDTQAVVSKRLDRIEFMVLSALNEIPPQSQVNYQSNVTGAKLADVGSADITPTDVRSANIRPTDVRSADVRSADVRSADVRSADARSSDLRSADLRSADVRPADIEPGHVSPTQANDDAVYLSAVDEANKPERYF